MRSTLETLFQDARYSLRRLSSRPTYTLLAVLTLALGAGGTAAILSIVRPLLLQPLPYAQPSQLGVLWNDGDWTEEEFLYLRPRFPGFRDMAAYYQVDATLERSGEPLRLLQGVASSAELFDVLGARPALGRTFQSGDDLPGAEPVAVLSYSLWKELGADPAIVGRSFNLGGATRRVIGVMPRGFWFPDPSIQIWTAVALSSTHHVGNYTLIGRAPGPVRPETMAGPQRAIAAALKGRFTYSEQWDKTRAPKITPIREHLVGGTRPALLATLVAMLLILAMSCVNVSALMLGQVGGRSTELAIRTALGAARRHLVQQIAIEALLIGLLAGALGAFLASLGFQTLIGALPLGPLAGAAGLDWSLLLAAILVAMVGSVAIALVPALVLWRGDLKSTMSAGRAGGTSAHGSRLEGGLVMAQIALAVLLAAGAGLVLKSVARLRDIDPGLRVERVAVVDATMPTQLPNEERRRAVLDFLPSLQSIPGVRAAAATQRLPLRGGGDSWGIGIEGKPDLPSSTTFFRIVTLDYFKTLGVSIRRGRGFLPSDRENTERATVINEALAAKYFPGEEPIGKTIVTGFPGGERVVGVVANVQEGNLTDKAEPARYVLFDQIPYAPQQVTYVLAATKQDALPRILEAARAAVRRDGRQLALQEAVPMERVFQDAVGAPGRVATLLSILAALSLVLGAIGVYGMISQFVARRTREYGIRMALGLSPAQVLADVLGRGFRLILAGSVIGIAAALGLTRLLSALLYGVRAADPQALGAAVLALLFVGTLAALVPARRASRTDPVSALRE